MLNPAQESRALSVITPHEAGLFRPGQGTVHVTACPHPFKLERVMLEVMPGDTLAEIVERVMLEAGLPPQLPPRAHVWIGDMRVPRELWHCVRPKPGAQVTVRVVPGSGSGLRTALALAVVVAANAAAPHLLAAAGVYASAAAASGTVAASLLSTGLSTPAPLAITSLPRAA